MHDRFVARSSQMQCSEERETVLHSLEMALEPSYLEGAAQSPGPVVQRVEATLVESAPSRLPPKTVEV